MGARRRDGTLPKLHLLSRGRPLGSSYDSAELVGVQIGTPGRAWSRGWSAPQSAARGTRLVTLPPDGYNPESMASLTYPEALSYLYSFVDYTLERSYRYTPDRFNLDRGRVLPAAAGAA